MPSRSSPASPAHRRAAPGRKALSHERIVDCAARAIRRGGFQGVGVADIMKEAGLTHGGFYAHFSSRNALLAEALERAGQASAERMRAAVARRRARGSGALRALVEAYLSDDHLRHCEAGCPVAALASEVPRQADEVRAAAAERVRALQQVVLEALPPDSPPASAAVITSQLVGALQLARSLGDNAEGRSWLATSRDALLAAHGGAAAPLGPATR